MRNLNCDESADKPATSIITGCRTTMQGDCDFCRERTPRRSVGRCDARDQWLFRNGTQSVPYIRCAAMTSGRPEIRVISSTTASSPGTCNSRRSSFGIEIDSALLDLEPSDATLGKPAFERFRPKRQTVQAPQIRPAPDQSSGCRQ